MDFWGYFLAKTAGFINACRCVQEQEQTMLFRPKNAMENLENALSDDPNRSL